MKLHIIFDNDVLLKYFNRGATPPFGIYWSHEGKTYPDHLWSDFGAVLLSGWSIAAEQLMNGATENKLEFMEGPASMEVIRHDNLLEFYPRHTSEVWKVPIDEFASELLFGIEAVIQRFEMLGITDDAGLSKASPRFKGMVDRLAID